MFSLRQLIFDTHQVTFVCAESQKCESLAHPSAVNTSSQRLFGVRNRSAWEHISHYSKRSLTFESDALNAITATLNDYKDKSKDAAFHAWGMPFAANVNVLDGSSPGPLSHVTFASENAIFGFSLAWYSASPDLRRRHGFPTWSWASCRANVGFLNLPYGTPDNVSMPDPELDVRLERLDGEVWSLSEYMSQNSSVQLSRYLHLEAWSVRSSLVFHPHEGRVMIDVGDEKYHLAGNIDLKSLPDDDDHKLIHDLMIAKDGLEAIIVFFSPEDYECAVQPFIITLMRVDDTEKPNEEVYERFGHISGLRLERKSQRRGRNGQAAGKGFLDRADIPSQNMRKLRRTVGWAAKVLDDQSRETQEAEEKFRKFRESLQQVGHVPQPAAVTTTSGQEVELETPQNEEIDDLDGGSHSTNSVSSSEDSDDHGDYTINMVVRRGHIKRLFPRIPMIRKSLIIR